MQNGDGPSTKEPDDEPLCGHSPRSEPPPKWHRRSEFEISFKERHSVLELVGDDPDFQSVLSSECGVIRDEDRSILLHSDLSPKTAGNVIGGMRIEIASKPRFGAMIGNLTPFQMERGLL